MYASQVGCWGSKPKAVVSERRRGLLIKVVRRPPSGWEKVPRYDGFIHGGWSHLVDG